MAQYTKGYGKYKFSDKHHEEQFKDTVAENMFACFHEGQYERCDEVATFYEQAGDIEPARALYKKTCDDHDYAGSCFNYARMCYMEQKESTDLQTPYDYYKKSCRHGDSRGCYMAGFIRQRKTTAPGQSASAAMEHFERGCRLFERHSCFQLHNMFRRGWGSDVPRDPEKALAYAVKTCEANGREGCRNAYLMLKNGDGVKQDEQLAEKYKIKGITLDIEKGFDPWKRKKKFRHELTT